MPEPVRTYGVILLVIGLLAGCTDVRTQVVKPDAPWSVRIADSFLARHPGNVTFDTGAPGEKWNYEQGLMLVALTRMSGFTGDHKYSRFVEGNLDRYIGEHGEIKSYKLTDYTLDNIGPGRALISTYLETKREKYRWAADTLRKQLAGQPRTHEGGFWHKKIYPDQMWLDGLFMAEPFYADYATAFHEPSDYDDIANQFIFIARHTFDTSTGLFFHGWDESKKERWSNPQTGCSASIWGRAIGWYAMGLADVLDFFPQDHPKRDTLVTILRNLCSSLSMSRDQQTGLWYLIINKGPENGNYIEASASCMFAYCFAKCANQGYVEKKYASIAEEVFRSITEHFVTRNADGTIDLNGTCGSAGLGGTPYRDGSLESYVREGKRTNDMRGLGPFLLAAIEIERGEEHERSN